MRNGGPVTTADREIVYVSFAAAISIYPLQLGVDQR